MRLVFSSERLETVEGVSKLLTDNGIENIIRNGRSYHGNRRRSFSYMSESGALPEVWVLHNDDKTRARELLFEAQLIESTRDTDSYLSRTYRENQTQASKRNRGLMLRLVALAVLAAVAAGTLLFRSHTQGNPTDVALTGPFDVTKARPIPSTLYVNAMQQGIAVGSMPVLCLSVNGDKPAATLMQKLNGNGKRILPANHCVRDPDPQYGSHTADNTPAEFVDITNFRASSATQGLIDVNTFHHNQWAHYRTYRVELVDGKWVVRNMTRHVAS